MSGILDLLDLPETIRRGDFVINLNEAMARPEGVLTDYAVTDDLRRAFDQALDLVRTSIEYRKSEGTYVHGSFGAGKSHFMALLSLLLANNKVAWEDEALHPLRPKHEWVASKPVLRLHFHMLGAESVEERLFGEYLLQIQAAHPGCAIPGFFRDEAVFDNADRLRGQMGDGKFFEELNKGTAAGGRNWGKAQATAIWSAETYPAARHSQDQQVRLRLFDALQKALLPLATRDAAFLDVDQGFEALSRHAASLGYAAVVLFLDEAILWLSQRASEEAWLNRELPKLIKLTDAGHSVRPIPLVSFLARQRNLLDLVGARLEGEAAARLRTALEHFSGRFSEIHLPDRNLPRIVQKRVVRPRNEDAKKTLDEAFDGLRRACDEGTWKTLLATNTPEAFRGIFPFSPALIETLVALSESLQRNRTALRLLVELLLRHLRDWRSENQVAVPVGDLWDALAAGEAPLDGAMRARFEAARRLYDDLLPIIRAEHGTTAPDRCQRLRADHEIDLGCSNCAEAACRNDNRIAKTLLLAALAPKTPALADLTVSKLVQLNTGLLATSRLQRPARLVTDRVQTWSAKTGLFRIGKQADPTVEAVLESIPVREIIQAAQGYNSLPARRRKLQELLFEALGLPTEARTETSVSIAWRGTNRRGTVVFGNVRDMTSDLLRASSDDDFRIVIDYPFDEEGRTPAQDEQKIEEFRDTGATTPSAAWLPSFLSEDCVRELGELLVLEKVLQKENWPSHCADLSPPDQVQARSQLENMLGPLKTRLGDAMAAAYRLRSDDDKLDPTHRIERNVRSLDSSWDFAGMRAATFPEALLEIGSELLARRWPRHKAFAEKVTTNAANKAFARMKQLVEADGRWTVDRTERKEWLILESLEFVTLTDSVVTLKPQACDQMEQTLRAAGLSTPTVEQVRRRFDPDGYCGHPREIEDLQALVLALLGARELIRDGRPIGDLMPGRLPDDAELVPARLPSREAWRIALDRSRVLWQVDIGAKALRPENVRTLAERLDQSRLQARKHRGHELVERLTEWAEYFSSKGPNPPRVRTARAVEGLLGALDVDDATSRVEALVNASLDGTSLQAMEKHLTTAQASADKLASKVTLGSFSALTGRTEPACLEILAQLAEVLAGDALLYDLPDQLEKLALRAQQQIRPASRVPASGPVQAPLPAMGQVVSTGRKVLKGTDFEGHLAELRQVLEEAGPDAELVLSWELRRP